MFVKKLLAYSKTRLALFLLLVTLFSSSCSLFENNERITLTANSWTGYSILFYAKERGWLNDYNVNIKPIVSLGESVRLYKAGLIDGFAGTNFEYSLLDESRPVVPFVLIDKSMGGDVVMINRPLDELKKETALVDVYLERESVNFMVFDDFRKQVLGKKTNFRFFDMDQAKIASKTFPDTHTSIVVTYSPYKHILKWKGFNEVPYNDYEHPLILDVLYIRKEVAEKNKSRLKGVWKQFKKAGDVLRSDPKGFYEAVKPYMFNIDYDTFEKSVSEIRWLYDHDAIHVNELKKSSLPTEYIAGSY